MFLSEAFTRPEGDAPPGQARLLAVATPTSPGATPSSELTEYFTELAHGPGREYFRPNVWPNTPDILPEALQYGGRAGVHGAAGAGGHAGRELRHLRPGLRAAASALPREPGGEEYLELGEVRAAPLGPATRADSLAAFIAPRQPHPPRQPGAASATTALRFLPVDNEQLIAYAKRTPDARQRGGLRGQPRSAPRAERLARRSTSTRSAWMPERAVPGARPADRRALPVAGRAQLRQSRPARVPAHVFRLRRRRAQRARFRLLLVSVSRPSR